MIEALPFKTPLQPYATWVMLILISILTLTNGFQVFVDFTASSFLAAYITIPIFLVLYLVHKAWFRTPWAIKIEDIDVITGKKEMDELAESEEEPVPKNWAQKAWFWLA
ncbi:hypothetical protein NPX13_g8519 [Xylaria arbuscula]|uniref:Amino acid permease/ SLC12A domain-containing protein n=1 Tax=Xylaria arbuscula TaxID=114810 RepID=A0A9W8N8K4_9PEZI|nr:hypothetical protein NPX13_g8519 [Xylaria arbuscula]